MCLASCAVGEIGFFDELHLDGVWVLNMCEDCGWIAVGLNLLGFWKT